LKFLNSREDKVKEKFDINVIEAKFKEIANSNLDIKNLSNEINIAFKDFLFIEEIKPEEKKETLLKYQEIWNATSVLKNLALNLSFANLLKTNLQDVDLHGVDLSDSNLTHGDMSNANLSNTNLSNANLTRTNLSGAICVYTDFTGARARSINKTEGKPFCTIGCLGATSRQEGEINSIGELINAITTEVSKDDIRTEDEVARIEKLSKVAVFILEQNKNLLSKDKNTMETPETLKLLTDTHAQLIEKYSYLHQKTEVDNAAKDIFQSSGKALAVLRHATVDKDSTMNKLGTNVLSYIASFILSDRLQPQFTLKFLRAFSFNIFNPEVVQRKDLQKTLPEAFANQFELKTSYVKAISARNVEKKDLCSRNL
jgi:hypothetical protein